MFELFLYISDTGIIFLTIILICYYIEPRVLNQKMLVSGIQCSLAGNQINSWWASSYKPAKSCVLFMFAFLAFLTESILQQPLTNVVKYENVDSSRGMDAFLLLEELAC